MSTKCLCTLSKTGANLDAIEKNNNESNPLSDDEIYEKYVTRVCKRAMIGWTPFQKRLPTEQEVSTWFGKWPDANIGIVTGEISNLVVFDLDSEDTKIEEIKRRFITEAQAAGKLSHPNIVTI